MSNSDHNIHEGLPFISKFNSEALGGYQMTSFEMELPSSPLKKEIFNKSIKLNPEITLTNYICSLLHFVTMLFSFLITDTLQPMILLHADYFSIDKSTSGELIAQILVIMLLFKIAISPFYGYCIDKFGRVGMLRYAACSIFLAYMSVPYQHTIFPGFIFSKLLFSNGGTIYGLLPFNADYVHDSTKGKAAGLQLTLGTFGGLLGAAFVKLLLFLGLNLGQCYVASGFVVFTVSMLYSFGLKPGNYYYKKKHSMKGVNGDRQSRESMEIEHTLREKFVIAWAEVKKSPWIMVSLLLTIVGNADFYILTIVFALYVKSFYGDTTAEADASNQLISFYQLSTFTVAAFMNLLAGYFVDKMNPMKIIVPAVLFTTVGFMFSLFVEKPGDFSFNVMVIVPGLCLPAIYTVANYLAIKHFPPEMRGTLSSYLALIGYGGYVFIALFGGVLFDRVSRAGPYVLYSMMLAVALVGILKIYYGKIKDTQYDNLHLFNLEVRREREGDNHLHDIDDK